MPDYRDARNSGANVAQAPREMQIPAQILAQEKNISELTEHVTALEARLSDILLRGSDHAEEKMLFDESLSEIADKLRANNNAINSLCVRLGDMIRRLDL